MPVCSNGHFLCRPCRDRIQLDAVDLAKCPSCTIDLGDATSLLASRIVERVKHECEHEGCEELVAFDHLENHQQSCLFRKVLCPGTGKVCKIELALVKVEEHVKTCPDISKTVLLNNAVIKLRMPEKYKGSGETLFWPSTTISAHGKIFFLRRKRENQNQIYETVMLGSAKECSGFLVTTKILDKDSKTFTANTSQPRPISQESWGHMGLILPEKALSSIWRPDGEQSISSQICIWARNGVMDRPDVFI